MSGTGWNIATLQSALMNTVNVTEHTAPYTIAATMACDPFHNIGEATVALWNASAHTASDIQIQTKSVKTVSYTAATAAATEHTL